MYSLLPTHMTCIGDSDATGKVSVTLTPCHEPHMGPIRRLLLLSAFYSLQKLISKRLRSFPEVTQPDPSTGKPQFKNCSWSQPCSWCILLERGSCPLCSGTRSAGSIAQDPRFSTKTSTPCCCMMTYNMFLYQRKG